ncbi:MAG TPA: hypothetical protein VNR59_00485 [Gaiellaceae bacterium]|jgi:hypothetical protein|nr:hypothetical protein [Gaiellaceae bacterium]HWJ44452.1 hypothetical protein [Gaiellaceae bacterium]
MPDVEIRPFSDQHVGAAAELLAVRHERHLAAEPLLAEDVDYHAQIEAIDGRGVVALRDGALRAYLTGEATRRPTRSSKATSATAPSRAARRSKLCAHSSATFYRLYRHIP